MSAPIPAATVVGDVYCELCGQRSVRAEYPGYTLAEVQRLLRAHQRSEVCGR